MATFPPAIDVYGQRLVTEGVVLGAGIVATERGSTHGRIPAGRILSERAKIHRCVHVADLVVFERVKADGGVFSAISITKERRPPNCRIESANAVSGRVIISERVYTDGSASIGLDVILERSEANCRVEAGTAVSEEVI
jgi:hypothetical protein